MQIKNFLIGIILVFLSFTLQAQALSKAQIKGNLSNAFVTIYKIEDNASKTLLFEETTDAEGLFSAHGAELDANKFYIYEVSGGVDTNNSRNNNGTLRAIVKGNYAQANDFTVSVVSEMLYIYCAKEVKYNYSALALQAALDTKIQYLLDSDIDGSTIVDVKDSLQFEYATDAHVINPFNYPDLESLLENIYSNRLDSFVEDVLKNQVVAFNIPSIVNKVVLSSDKSTIYIAGGTNGLQIMDFNISEAGTFEFASLLGEYDADGDPYYTGLAKEVTISTDGTKAYVADRDSGLQIIDISNPLSPVMLGGYNTPGTANEVNLSPDGTKAYIADGTSLQIIDVSTPESPVLVGSYAASPGSANGVTLSADGTKAYLANYGNGLNIIDISNPSSPILLGIYDTPGTARKVALSDDETKAYVADGSSGLQIIDISNPASPTLLGNYDTPDSALSITISPDGNTAYVADYDTLQIINVTDPSTPVLLTSYDTPWYPHDITLSPDGDTAYVADYYALQIIDISNPASPRFLDSYDTPGTASGISLSGDGTKAYIADGTYGLQIIALPLDHKPAQQLVGTYDTLGVAYDVSISSDKKKAYVADGSSGLQIIDITDPATPVLLGGYNTSGTSYGVTHAADGTKVYVADGSSGLQIIDITDPAAPTLLGNYDTPGNAYKVTLSSDGTKAYVADTYTLQIIDVSNPASPILLSTYDTSSFSVCLSSDETKAYVGGASSGLQIIDITDPAAPTLLGNYNPSGNVRGISLSSDGTKAYLADYSFGLHIIDVSYPAVPTIIKSIRIQSPIETISISADDALIYSGASNRPLKIVNVDEIGANSLLGRYNTQDNSARDIIFSRDGLRIYIADNTSGLQITDITDPAVPIALGSYDTSGNALGLSLSYDETKVFVADGASGLHCIDITNPSMPIMLGTYDTPGMAYDVSLSHDGTKAYVADGSSGLHIIDVTDPSTPVLLGSYNALSSAYKIKLSNDGTKAYVIDILSGLKVIDISNSASPVLIGSYDTPANTNNMTLSSDETKAYITGGFGLHVIDISDPTLPVLLGSYLSSLPSGIALSVDEAKAYVADYYSGLHILGVTNPAAPVLLDKVEVFDSPELVSSSPIDSKIILSHQNDGILIFDLELYKPITDGDSDGDGVNDSEDAFPYNPSETTDTDLDGLGDNSDPDIDGDGVLNESDAFPNDATESIDTDGDGIGNNTDTDIDGDGISNIVEIENGFNPYDATDLRLDNDGDGIDNGTEIIAKTDFSDPNDYPEVIADPIATWTLSDMIPYDPWNYTYGETISKAYIYTAAVTGTYVFEWSSSEAISVILYDTNYNQLTDSNGYFDYSSVTTNLNEGESYILVINAYTYGLQSAPSFTITSRLTFEMTLDDIITDLPVGNTFTEVGQSHKYTFTAAQTGLYMFATSGDLNTVGTLRDTYGNILNTDNYSEQWGDYNFSLYYKLTAGQTYTLNVDEYDSALGSYGLYSWYSPIEDIGNGISELPLNDSIDTAYAKNAYTFVAAQSGNYEFFSTGSTLDTVVTLLDENYRIISFNDDGDIDSNFKISRNLVAGHHYTLVVEDFFGDTGEFTLHSTFTETPVINDIINDLPTEIDTFSSIYENVIYTFTPVQTGNYNIFAASNFDTFGKLYSATGELIAYNNDYPAESTDFALMSIPLVAGETYILEVEGYGYTTGSYQILSSFFDPFADAIVINDVILDLPLAQTIEQSMGWNNYTFTATQTGTYSFTTPELITRVELYNDRYELIAVNVDENNYLLDSASQQLEKGKTYYLKVTDISMEVVRDYNLTCDFTALDTDNDGIPDDTDPDDDNDGILDEDDTNSTNPDDPVVGGNLDSDNDGIVDGIDLDDDNDGMTDEYEDTYGLNRLDPYDAEEDPDEDGYTNLQESEAGTDPTDYTDIPQNMVSNKGAITPVIMYLLN